MFTSSRHQDQERLLSPLSRKILLVNLTTLLIPLLGFTYLADYRRELITLEANSLMREAHLFATAIGEGAVYQVNPGLEYLQLTPALNILNRLARDSGHRAVLFLPDGTLLADTRSNNTRIIARPLTPLNMSSYVYSFFENIIDNIHQLLDRLEVGRLEPMYMEPQRLDVRLFPHVMESLGGGVGQQVWRMPPNDFLVSVAVPIRPMHQLFGSVMLLNRSDSINNTIRDLRVNIMIAFIVALLFSVITSLLLARTMVRPLSQLAHAAAKFDHHRGTLSELEIPIVKTPRDEIGALSRAMAAMVQNLKRRINSIERFAADVAHEIRNPLAAVQSVIETLPLVKKADKRQELMGMAQAELQRLDALISDILESSQLDSALLDETREEIDLITEVKRFVSHYQGLNPQQLISVKLPPQASRRPLLVKMKEHRIEQILQNLLDNASDFSPDDGEITLQLERDGYWAVLRIGDSGPGIPEAVLGKIFNRFYSDRREARKGTHSGLGLSIVNQIVDSHGGTIRASNQPPPATGAEMEVRLPLSE